MTKIPTSTIKQCDMIKDSQQFRNSVKECKDKFQNDLAFFLKKK